MNTHRILLKYEVREFSRSSRGLTSLQRANEELSEIHQNVDSVLSIACHASHLRLDRLYPPNRLCDDVTPRDFT